MRFLIAAAAMAATLPLSALAQDDPVANAIEARQGYFKMLAANMGVLSGIAKGDIAYDEAAAVAAATNINALSRYDVTMHFIESSTNAEAGDTTEALPETVSDKAGFSAKYADLQKAADGIPEAVKGGQDKVGPVVAALGGACKACHDNYRVK